MSAELTNLQPVIWAQKSPTYEGDKLGGCEEISSKQPGYIPFYITGCSNAKIVNDLNKKNKWFKFFYSIRLFIFTTAG